jgi:hypothetical protein
MNNLSLFIIPVLVILILVIRRAPASQKSSAPRPDFISQATAAIHGGVEISSSNGDDYSYDVVGESFQRDHLVALIRAKNAFEVGELHCTAVLEMEPTNEFDPTAVKVMVEGVQVGYIAKFDSPAVTEMITKSGKKSYEVPARLGWGTDSPQPVIGVKLALTVQGA